MKQKTIVISIVIIVILIIITIIGILINLSNEKSSNISRYELPVEENKENIKVNKTNNLQQVTVRNDFYIVKNCIINFYKNWTWEEERKEKLKTVYNILDIDYKKYKNITLDNLEEKLKNIEKIDVRDFNLYVKYMYYIENETNQKFYLVRGTFGNLKSNKKYDITTIVNIDTKKEIYSIVLNDYISEKIGKIGTDGKISYEPHEIEKNDYNKYTYEFIDDTRYINDIFKEFKYNLIQNSTEAYKQFQEEYSTKRFGNLDNYKQYIKENYNEIKNISAQGFQKNNIGTKTQYVVKDQYENLYIFDVEAPTKYTVQLDTYTLGTESFNETYDNSSDNKKVQMNINKFINMINVHDYRTAYKFLANSFKQNKMNSEEIFKNFIKKNFYNHNKVEYSNYTEIGNKTYSYKLKIKDLTGNNSKENSIRIIMQLLDDRNFQMSLSVEN